MEMMDKINQLPHVLRYSSFLCFMNHLLQLRITPSLNPCCRFSFSWWWICSSLTSRSAPRLTRPPCCAPPVDAGAARWFLFCFMRTWEPESMWAAELVATHWALLLRVLCAGADAAVQIILSESSGSRLSAFHHARFCLLLFFYWNKQTKRSFSDNKCSCVSFKAELFFQEPTSDAGTRRWKLKKKKKNFKGGSYNHFNQILIVFVTHFYIHSTICCNTDCMKFQQSTNLK